MRRADRLFEIVQILRRERRPITADAIAAELETSKRSVYRDIAALMAQRVPIRGEAGIGYVLESGFDLPPLMLNPEEVEAAVLGAQWVAGHGDPALANAARNLIAKIAAVVPAEMRALVDDPAARTPPAWKMPADAVDATTLRQAIRARPQDRPFLPQRRWAGFRPHRLARPDRLSRQRSGTDRLVRVARRLSAASASTGS